jgi:hypothetical protein
MRTIIENFVFNMLACNKSEDFSVSNKQNNSKMQMFAFLIGLIVSQLLLLLLGKWLWNSYLVSVVNVKQINSIWQLLGISILLKLLIN